MSTPNLHSQIMNLHCEPSELAKEDGHGMRTLCFKEGHAQARHAAAELVAAHISTAPGGMTRDEAFELLEGHLGPQATINIHESASRHYSASEGKRKAEVTMFAVFAYVPDKTFIQFDRPSLSEAVAAVLSHVPAYKKEGEE